MTQLPMLEHRDAPDTRERLQSVFDLFTVGIGPSSSHTVGPMRAARAFVQELEGDDLMRTVGRVRVELFGSLGLTGRGHRSTDAVLLGLEGHAPETVDTSTLSTRTATIRRTGTLNLLGRYVVPLAEQDIVLHRRTSLPLHPNGMTFTAWTTDGTALRSRTYYSVGGGSIVGEEGPRRPGSQDAPLRYPFTSAAELVSRAITAHQPISAVMMSSESKTRTVEDVRAGLLDIWRVMQTCVTSGCTSQASELPGVLKVRRRAPELHRRLLAAPHDPNDPLRVLDWVNLFALSVNEENAAGGRVVTAPTNGAAGIVPAVLHYYTRFVPGSSDDAVVTFLLTAGAIGLLYKRNASISGAEVGCQGEVGAASSMAAGALCEVLGGDPRQVENAAEIAMEHHLGMTCDPVAGLVQVPCIERNAMGAAKAINAARLALCGDGEHIVSLDNVITTMRDTGVDMLSKYKETSLGGLAVNVIEC